MAPRCCRVLDGSTTSNLSIKAGGPLTRPTRLPPRHGCSSTSATRAVVVVSIKCRNERSRLSNRRTTRGVPWPELGEHRIQ
jgi:hypothetical protein